MNALAVVGELAIAAGLVGSGFVALTSLPKHRIRAVVALVAFCALVGLASWLHRS